ncbi:MULTISPECIES: hypothetical protein [unclassified Ruminococcus]|uniref:hypothetical protein n=1 Tax=unclassified Ruminococcus TaxID=2608920 RepID=UPI001113D3A7|nr:MULTISPECIES: hypothetical protein [unclassified Ruminococcus]
MRRKPPFNVFLARDAQLKRRTPKFPTNTKSAGSSSSQKVLKVLVRGSGGGHFFKRVSPGKKRSQQSAQIKKSPKAGDVFGSFIKEGWGRKTLCYQ